jgi:4'-phosphopantetheinyl transferase EntD
MTTRSIDLEGLPEPQAQAIAAQVELLRRAAAAKKAAKTPPHELPVWPLGVIGRLTREEIYDDRV